MSIQVTLVILFLVIIIMLIIWIIFWRFNQGKLFEEYAKQKGLKYSKDDIFNLKKKLTYFEPSVSGVESTNNRPDLNYRIFNSLKHFIQNKNVLVFTGFKGTRDTSNEISTHLHLMAFFETNNNSLLSFMRFKIKEKELYYHLTLSETIPLNEISKDNVTELSKNKLFPMIREIVDELNIKYNFSFCLRDNKVLITYYPILEGKVDEEMIDEILILSEKIKIKIDKKE